MKMGFSQTLVKLIGNGCIILGIILTALGVSGLAFEGLYAPTFYIGGRLVTAQEGGQITSTVGIILLLAGIVITYIHSKKIINF
jgi:uncharacterized membrane protein